MVKKFKIGILNFRVNRLYLNSWTDFGKFRAAMKNLFVEFVTFFWLQPTVDFPPL